MTAIRVSAKEPQCVERIQTILRRAVAASGHAEREPQSEPRRAPPRPPPRMSRDEGADSHSYPSLHLHANATNPRLSPQRRKQRDQRFGRWQVRAKMPCPFGVCDPSDSRAATREGFEAAGATRRPKRRERGGVLYRRSTARRAPDRRNGQRRSGCKEAAGLSSGGASDVHPASRTQSSIRPREIATNGLSRHRLR